MTNIAVLTQTNYEEYRHKQDIRIVEVPIFCVMNCFPFIFLVSITLPHIYQKYNFDAVQTLV